MKYLFHLSCRCTVSDIAWVISQKLPRGAFSSIVFYFIIFVCVSLRVRLFIDVVFTHLSQNVPRWIPVNIKQQTKSENSKSMKKEEEGSGKRV